MSLGTQEGVGGLTEAGSWPISVLGFGRLTQDIRFSDGGKLQALTCTHIACTHADARTPPTYRPTPPAHILYAHTHSPIPFLPLLHTLLHPPSRI